MLLRRLAHLAFLTWSFLLSVSGFNVERRNGSCLIQGAIGSSYASVLREADESSLQPSVGPPSNAGNRLNQLHSLPTHAEEESAHSEHDSHAVDESPRHELAHHSDADNDTDSDETLDHLEEHLTHHLEEAMSAEQRSSSRSLAWSLIGSVTFVMSIFYMVHYPDPDIVEATWKTLSASVSIFCAVLFFKASKQASVDFFGEKAGDHHSPPDVHAVLLSFGRFLLFYIAVNAMMVCARDRPWALAVIGNEGAHVIGFAAIDAFGSLQHLEPFNGSPTCSFLAVPITGLAIIMLCTLVGIIRRFFVSRMYPDTEAEQEELEEQCNETEDEFSGIAVGLLISLAIRFVIIGHLPPIHGSPRSKTTSEVIALLCAAIFLAICVVLWDICVGFTKQIAGPMLRRLINSWKAVLAMAMGWCFLYTGQWCFWEATGDAGIGSGDKMTARMTMALVFTVGGFLSIFVIDFIADSVGTTWAEGFRSLMCGLVLLLGLSWEACFDSATDCVVESIQDRTLHSVVTMGLPLGICIIVLPAWAMYILPNQLKAKEMLHKPVDS